MSVSISDYVATNSNWVATVFRQLLHDVVVIDIDEVDFSTIDGSMCCTVYVLHSMSCFDFKTISVAFGERYWFVHPSLSGCGYSISFHVTKDEL